jgi:hypothetical protein
MSYFTLFFQKNWPRYVQKTEKISEVTVFKNQYFLNKIYRPLAVLREEASDSLLPVVKVGKITKY